jgi:hypothetical protein
VFVPYLPRRLWGAFAVNSAVLTAATVVLAVSPVTVSFPIAVAEAVVLACGLATMLGLNVALLRRVLGSAFDVAPRPTGAPAGATLGWPNVEASIAADRVDARLLVCWAGPSHGRAESAQEWATSELRRVMAAERVGAARLARLRSASLRYGASHDWLLELDVQPGREAQTWLDSPAWAAWLSDLRALGMRPATMVAERGRVLGREKN